MGTSDYDKVVAATQRIDAHEFGTPDPAFMWTITTINPTGDSTPIICTTLNRAREVVDTNEGDIWEFYYPLLVIEGVIPDRMWSTARAPRFWYVWDYENKCWAPIKTPESYENVCGFGIG